MSYYPNYQPKDEAKFRTMEKMFKTATDKKMLEDLSMLFILDMSYDRQDLLVAMGRIERERGWK